MDYTCIIFGALFITAGLVFAFGKAHIYLSAWKNMPKEEKDKIKIVPLCQNVGAIIALSGIIFLVKGLWHGFEGRGFVIAMVIWLVIAGLDVWYIGKSKRYRNE